ncbi:MAG: hypothetical protein V1664_00575 [Candidatus Uhrbacteria bacterium]
MFENIKKEPEDIFDKTDNPNLPPLSPTATFSAVPNQPTVSSVPAPFLQAEVATANRSVKKSPPWKAILIIIGGGIVIAVAAYFISRFLIAAPSSEIENLSNVSNTVQNNSNSGVKNNTTTNSVPSNVNSQTAKPVVPAENIPPAEDVSKDTDKDGLSDTREAELGTSPDKADTDADGLFDREEVEVYKTKPLSPDTDGDTYLDGAEVKSGYNPNGAGKLFDLPGSN